MFISLISNNTNTFLQLLLLLLFFTLSFLFSILLLLFCYFFLFLLPLSPSTFLMFGCYFKRFEESYLGLHHYLTMHQFSILSYVLRLSCHSLQSVVFIIIVTCVRERDTCSYIQTFNQPFLCTADAVFGLQIQLHFHERQEHLMNNII